MFTLILRRFVWERFSLSFIVRRGLDYLCIDTLHSQRLVSFVKKDVAASVLCKKRSWDMVFASLQVSDVWYVDLVAFHVPNDPSVHLHGKQMHITSEYDR